MSAFEKYEFTLPCPLRAQSSAERSWRKHAFDAGVAHGLEMASQLVRKQARTARMAAIWASFSWGVIAGSYRL